MASKCTMSDASPCTRVLSTVSGIASGNGSPSAVPAKRRRPAEKTSAGASVSGSTMTSPRIPCALRNRPTIMSSGVVTSRSLGRLAAGHRHRRCLPPGRNPHLVPRAKDASLPQQRARRIGRLGADVEPVGRACRIDLQSTLGLTRIVMTDSLDEATIARALRVCDDDAIERELLPPDPAESNFHHERVSKGWWYTNPGLIAHSGISGAHPERQTAESRKERAGTAARER